MPKVMIYLQSYSLVLGSVKGSRRKIIDPHRMELQVKMFQFFILQKHSSLFLPRCRRQTKSSYKIVCTGQSYKLVFVLFLLKQVFVLTLKY